MSAGRESPIQCRPSTTAALDGDHIVYFTDLVYEGDVVDVFPTFEQAEAEEGPSRKMRVSIYGFDWELVPVDE